MGARSQQCRCSVDRTVAREPRAPRGVATAPPGLMMAARGIAGPGTSSAVGRWKALRPPTRLPEQVQAGAGVLGSMSDSGQRGVRAGLPCIASAAGAGIC
jgi:hypothetical protein